MTEKLTNKLQNKILAVGGIIFATGVAGAIDSYSPFAPFHESEEEIRGKLTQNFPGYSPEKYQDARLTDADFHEVNQKLIVEQRLKELAVPENVAQAENYLTLFKQAESSYQAELSNETRKTYVEKTFSPMLAILGGWISAIGMFLHFEAKREKRENLGRSTANR